MDALFGLPRKIAAGKSVRPPLSGNLFFEDQTTVDEYVYLYPKGRPVSAMVHTYIND